jgi:hypothetical protein
MNYDKKRKRQSGRQTRKEPTYRIWIDEAAQIHATIDKPNLATSRVNRCANGIPHR